MEEDLVKTESRAVTYNYLDVWRSGTFLDKPQINECATDHKQEP